MSLKTTVSDQLIPKREGDSDTLETRFGTDKGLR